jgi:hypothetical protein
VETPIANVCRHVRSGRLEALTVTVDDVDALARALEAHGITGQDERGS